MSRNVLTKLRLWSTQSSTSAQNRLRAHVKSEVEDSGRKLIVYDRDWGRGTRPRGREEPWSRGGVRRVLGRRERSLVRSRICTSNENLMKREIEKVANTKVSQDVACVSVQVERIHRAGRRTNSGLVCVARSAVRTERHRTLHFLCLIHLCLDGCHPLICALLGGDRE